MPATTSSAVTADTQVCRICERELPLTDANFYRPPGRDFETWCRSCGRPRNGRNRKFGVEIEFVGTDDRTVYTELRRRGLRVRAGTEYTHHVMSEWKIVPDGSVYGGWELVSPPLRGTGGERQVKLACEALQAAGARVDRSCGLHVHFEVRDLNKRQFGRLFKLWSANTDAIESLVARSRRGCQWARRVSWDDAVAIENLHTDHDGELGYFDRYRALNVSCFPRYGTVENRMHQGTLNANKILAWIAFGKAVISFAKSSAALVEDETIESLLDKLAADHGLAAARTRYLKGRAAILRGERPQRQPERLQAPGHTDLDMVAREHCERIASERRAQQERERAYAEERERDALHMRYRFAETGQFRPFSFSNIHAGA